MLQMIDKNKCLCCFICKSLRANFNYMVYCDAPNVVMSNISNYLKIKTTGSINFEKQIYLYNLNDQGTPGFEVINPIIINNKRYWIFI